MLKLDVSAELKIFRESFREWLSRNPPPSRGVDAQSLADFIGVGRAWQKTLSSGKWLGVYWPGVFGGRGLSLVEEAVVQEELVRAGAPQILGLFGLTMVGPVLIEHGTEQQKSRFLTRILSADDIWCQGFSEPGAGSDLAAIKTRATLDGDHFVVSGQKIWTSFAQIADFCFCLCRTSDTGKKHEGLTYLLIPMTQPGITVRPLKQISGDEEFNEVFFDEVRVPLDCVVGTVGEGWKIAISTLMHERVVLTFARQLQSEGILRDLLTAYGNSQSSLVQRNLARTISETCATRALAYRHLADYSRGSRPGPEGSLDKLLWSESFQRLTRLQYSLAGTEPILGEARNHAAHSYLYSRGRTIAAGSSEIQRNIISERLLELPRLKYQR